MFAARVVMSGLDSLESGMDAANKARLKNLKAAGLVAKSVIADAMKGAAPVYSGRTKRSIGGDVWMTGAEVHLDVGPEVRRGGGLAHMTEFGTKERFTRAGVARGHTRAQGWAQKAVDSVEERVFDLIGESVEVW